LCQFSSACNRSLPDICIPLQCAAVALPVGTLAYLFIPRKPMI
jgi:hypothetical protein